jgi:hypothetical protein
MKKYLSNWEVADALTATDNGNGFSRIGAYALAEYYEQYEEETGEEIELDVIAIRCDWSEFTSWEKVADAYGDKDYEKEEGYVDDCKAYIQDNTEYIEFEGGVLVRDF